MSDSERSIMAVQAVVMIYDNPKKTWITAGVTEGPSKVQIYHHPTNNTFRVVARKIQDHEIVINSAIVKNLKYNRATEIFHQWRDRQANYGLNFVSSDDAENFGQAMENVLYSLNAVSQPPPPPPAPSSAPPAAPPMQTPKLPQPATITSNRMGETNDFDNSNENQRTYGFANRAAPAPASTPMQPRPTPNLAPPKPPSIQTPNAPNAPPAPPFAPPNPPTEAAAPPPPSGGAPPPPCGGPPPPPPPPPPPGPSMGMKAPPASDGGGGLASALAAAKLKKVEKPKEEDNLPVASSTPASAAVARPAPSGGGGDMMSEMAQKLARMKAKTENVSTPDCETPAPPMTTLPKTKTWSSNVQTPMKKPPQPVTSDVSTVPTTREDVRKDVSSAALQNSDLELMKQQILTEMRQELNKIKDEILDAIKAELNRR